MHFDQDLQTASLLYHICLNLVKFCIDDHSRKWISWTLAIYSFPFLRAKPPCRQPTLRGPSVLIFSIWLCPLSLRGPQVQTHNISWKTSLCSESNRQWSRISIVLLNLHVVKWFVCAECGSFQSSPNNRWWLFPYYYLSQIDAGGSNFALWRPVCKIIVLHW